jgi:cytochrome P450
MSATSTAHQFPPGPHTRSPFGQLFRFVPDPLGFLVGIQAQYGDLVHFRIRNRNVFLVNDPADIEGILVTHSRGFVKNPGFQNIKRVLGEGLLSSEGEFHLRQRRMIQPAFHRQQIAAYAPLMVEEAQAQSQKWQGQSQVDVLQEMIALTLRVVSRALFGVRLADQTRAISQAVDDAMSLFHQAASPLSLLLARLPGVGDRRFRQGRARLDRSILHIIQTRRAEPSPADDLLSRLIAAEDSGTGMSDTQVRDEALTLLLAGHETTATALAWTWYLLSQHPQVEQRLHAELEEALAGYLPTAADLPRLPYTRQVLAESLRLYPSIYMFGRQTLNGWRIRNYEIPAGSSLIISPYLVHHDPRHYPDPERFDPERWAPGARAGAHKLSYLPFSAGPRGCIGEPFAWQEAMLILVALAQDWKLRLAPGTHVPVQPRITLRPKGGLLMELEARHPQTNQNPWEISL